MGWGDIWWGGGSGYIPWRWVAIFGEGGGYTRWVGTILVEGGQSGAIYSVEVGSYIR